MMRFNGKSLSPGYARGTAFVYAGSWSPEIPRFRIEHSQISGEIRRFEAALRNSIGELETLRDRVLPDLGKKETGIIESHLALLKDPEFVDRVKTKVGKDLVNVEHAVDDQINTLEKFLKDLQSEYLRERAKDIRDVGQRVLRHLRATPDRASSTIENLPPNSVIVARDLFPSDTLQLDRKHVVGIITEEGGLSSHASILARSLGIPSVTGIPEIACMVCMGDPILVDAETGAVFVHPSPRVIAQFEKAEQQYQASLRTLITDESKECITLDGHAITLYGNIGRVEEADLIAPHFLKGIGLFRTEYLFLDSPRPPTLQAQFLAYRRTAEILGGLPVVIRTLDLGGDKTPAFLAGDSTFTQVAGRRGLRFALLQRTLLLTQLRAILRAGKYGHVRVMFPMVLEGGDLQQAIDLLHEAAKKERISRLPPIGAMIETPSAVFEIDGILQRVDFVSIGTNDLTQFTLAIDRNSAGSFDDYAVLHPGVLKSISLVVEAARSKHRKVSVCGEVAGDAAVAGLLIGLGIRELSMGSVRAAAVRHLIRSVRVKDLEKLAGEALRTSNVKDVQDLLSEFRKSISG